VRDTTVYSFSCCKGAYLGTIKCNK